jgi:hypothetical protein
VKRMHVGEEEVSLSQPITAMVPLEEEDVSVPQGLRRLLPEEEDVTVPLEHPLSRSQPPLSQSHRRKKSHRAPPIVAPPEEEEAPVPLVVVLSEGRGCLVPVLPLVNSLPFFFSKMQDILLTLFPHKRDRFVG